MGRGACLLFSFTLYASRLTLYALRLTLAHGEVLMARRAHIPNDVRIQVLTEAGYQCAVPQCAQNIVLDLHHLIPVAEDGPPTADNLLPMCPTCHALYERGHFPPEAVRIWKGMLVSMSQRFDRLSIDLLLFLANRPGNNVRHVSTGDAIRYAGLNVAGLMHINEGGQPGDASQWSAELHLTPKGIALVEAWKAGRRDALEAAMALNHRVEGSAPDP